MPAAIAEFREALRFNPKMVDAHTNLAIGLAARGEEAKALRHLEIALRLNPGEPRARDLLARLEARADTSTQHRPR